jgi:hypothetical protein
VAEAGELIPTGIVVKAMPAADAPAEGALPTSRASGRDATDVAGGRVSITAAARGEPVGCGLPTVWLMESLFVACVPVRAETGAAGLRAPAD